MSTTRWCWCISHAAVIRRSCRSVASPSLSPSPSIREAAASGTSQRRRIHTSSTSSAVEATLKKRSSSPPPPPPPPSPPRVKVASNKRHAQAVKPASSTRSQSALQRDQDPHDDHLVLTIDHDVETFSSHSIPEDELLSALYPAWEQLSSPADSFDASRERPLPDLVYDDIEGGQVTIEEEDHLVWKDMLEELGSDRKVEKKPSIPPAAKVDQQRQAVIAPSQGPASPKPPRRTAMASSIKKKEAVVPPVVVPIAPALLPLGEARDLVASPRPVGISPFIPSPYGHPNEPHSRPLLSRYDWRLSATLPPRSEADGLPPPLDAPSSNLYQGTNKLVGVGPPPYAVGRNRKDVELWGWKTKVPAGEKGTWPSADRHRQRLDRLLDLTEEAEEKSYLELLARSGTSQQREAAGRTVCRAQGMWLTNASRANEIVKMSQEDKEKLRKKASGAGAVSAWWSCAGVDLDEMNGYKFTPGTVLRFTPLKSENTGNGPAPPASDKPRYPQGSLLEVKDGQLIVVFEELEMWVIGEEEFRIDFGLDDASYHLQRAAIDNLYFDSARQRRYNARTVEAAQANYMQAKITPTLREWTLQSTDVRELIVPVAQEPIVEPIAEDGLHDDSPAVELKHLPSPELPTPPEPLHVSNPSSLLCDNQLINSWVKRHQRSPPLSIEGDPVLRLNESQTRAVAMAMSESLSLIQGPPGTGKSATLVTLIHLLKSHFRIPQPILLCAPTHVSIDHLLSLLIDAGLNPLRTGKASRVREELRPWTIEKRREGHPLWNRCEEAREQTERLREELAALREEPEPTDKEAANREAELEELHKKEWRKFVALEQRLYSSLLATADVFCSTAIGAGATKVMNVRHGVISVTLHGQTLTDAAVSEQMIDFPIVFLDEAAMCTEPVSLIPLMKGAQHVCFIGDQKQLPAVVKSRMAVHERLHVSLFERLMSEQSVQTVLLDTQYRMRPHISSFPNQAFYHSALQDARSVSARSTLPKSSYLQVDTSTSETAPCVFVSHSGLETAFRQSTLNQTEVDIIIGIVGDLLSRNPRLNASSIGIISPYASQTRLLRDTFATGYYPGSRVIDQWGPDIAERAASVEVNTVDGYQGREKSIIILSTVRSNRSNFIGFLADRRRLNVALTRARDLLFVVGNEKTLSLANSGYGEEEASVESDAGVWRRFLEWYRQRGLIRPWGANRPSARADKFADATA